MHRNRSYHESSALRPVDWRWRLAEQLVDGRHHLSKREDEATAAAVHYLRALRRCTRELHERRLAERMPAVTSAHRLQIAGRWQGVAVRTRLLAGRSNDQVAKSVGLSAATIDCFTGLLFDVRQSLTATGYIWHHVLRPRGEMSERKWHEVLAMRAGFFCGPAAADLALSALDPATFQQPLDLKTEEGRGFEMVRIWAALEQLPSDQKTGRELLKITPFLLDALAKIQAPRRSHSDFWDAAAAIWPESAPGSGTETSNEDQNQEAA